MSAKADIFPGKRFGRLIAVRRVYVNSWRTRWLCQCDCGTSKEIRQQLLTRGDTQSCGCLRKEQRAARNSREKRTHYMTTTPEYKAWVSMIQRCYNSNTESYPHYGGRGITVCDRWHESFESFFADVGLRPTPRHSIERVRVNGNYEPGNVCWATSNQQARNKRSTLRSVIDGENLCLADIAERFGIGYSTVLYRFNAGLRGRDLLIRRR